MQKATCFSCHFGQTGILSSYITPGWIKIPFPISFHDLIIAYPALILPATNGFAFSLNASDDLLKHLLGTRNNDFCLKHIKFPWASTVTWLAKTLHTWLFIYLYAA